jgi:hypothetical protein
MNSLTKTIIGVTAGLLLGAGWWAIRRSATPANGTAAAGTTSVEPASPQVTEDRRMDGADALSEALRSLHKSETASETAAALGALKKILQGMAPGESSAWITERLDSGDDLATGLGFVIGTDQSLSEWPGFRVFLLDLLLTVDPGAAAAMGRKILQSPTSPDEWALAMRNLGKSSAAAEDIALLKTKSREMLHNTEWRTNPSTGYLEAFDVIVHTRDTALSPELIAWCGDTTNKAVRHASFLTLDRLVQSEPAAMLKTLAASAESHPDSRLMISNMIARADVRDPVQRELVEKYLLDERRTAAELQAFAGVFPNANQFVSRNLLTHMATVGGGTLAVADRAALDVVGSWLTDPRFSRIHALLRETHERLNTFVPR